MCITAGVSGTYVTCVCFLQLPEVSPPWALLHRMFNILMVLVQRSVISDTLVTVFLVI